MTSVEASVATPDQQEVALQEPDELTVDTLELPTTEQHLATVTDIGSRSLVETVARPNVDGDQMPKEEPFDFSKDLVFRAEAIRKIRQAFYESISRESSGEHIDSVKSLVLYADRHFDTQSPQAIAQYLYELVQEVQGSLYSHSTVRRSEFDATVVLQAISDHYVQLLGIEKRGNKVITGAIDIIHKVGGGTVRAWTRVTGLR